MKNIRKKNILFNSFILLILLYNIFAFNIPDMPPSKSFLSMESTSELDVSFDKDNISTSANNLTEKILFYLSSESIPIIFDMTEFDSNSTKKHYMLYRYYTDLLRSLLIFICIMLSSCKLTKLYFEKIIYYIIKCDGKIYINSSEYYFCK